MIEGAGDAVHYHQSLRSVLHCRHQRFDANDCEGVHEVTAVASGYSRWLSKRLHAPRTRPGGVRRQRPTLELQHASSGHHQNRCDRSASTMGSGKKTRARTTVSGASRLSKREAERALTRLRPKSMRMGPATPPRATTTERTPASPCFNGASFDRGPSRCSHKPMASPK